MSCETFEQCAEATTVQTGLPELLQVLLMAAVLWVVLYFRWQGGESQG